MSPLHPTRRLILEEATRSSDGAGGAETSWAAKGTLWAEVTPLSPRSAQAAAGPTQLLPVRILLRGAPMGAPSRPKAGQRLREGARLYLIDAVTEADPLGRTLLCLAHEEVVP